MDSTKKFIFNPQNKKKTIASALLVVALLLIAVFATLAYLNSTTETLDNKMTPTKLRAEIDETIVDEYGVPKTEEQAGRTADPQNYKMVPGKTYTKDPILHIEAGSEPAYVYMIIDNPIEEYEAAGNTIQYQMLTAGWLEYSGAGLPTDKQGKVYYKVDPVDARSYVSPATLNVSSFENFTLATGMDMPKDPLHVNITGYAIQSDGFNSAIDAWDALYPKGKSLTATYGKQKVTFVPAFVDGSAATYLANVTFYNASGNEIKDITDAIKDGTLTMNVLYGYYTNTDESKKPTRVSNSGNTEVTFYGILNEKSWDNVFYQSTPVGGFAEGLNNTFKTWLNENGLKTVYFDNNDGTTPTSEGGWDTGERPPKLNGVNYSNQGSGTSTFLEAYGGKNGGIIGKTINLCSSRANSATYVFIFSPTLGKWATANRSGINTGVVISLAF